MGGTVDPHIGKTVILLGREYLIKGAPSWSAQYVELTDAEDETIDVIRPLSLVLAHLSNQ